MFEAKHKKVPCVGVSIGIERIFTLIERKLEVCTTLGYCNVLILFKNQFLVEYTLKI